MSTEFQISGEIAYRRTRESNQIIKAIFEQLEDSDSSCQVALVKGRISTLEITGGYTTSWHSSSRIPELLHELAPFAEGAGSFDCEQEGEEWTEYVGTTEECAKLQSHQALVSIQSANSKLNNGDRSAALKLLAARDSTLKQYVIGWDWTTGGQFDSAARMTPEQAQALEANLERRADECQDIQGVFVSEWQPVQQDHATVTTEIVEALGAPTCATCFAETSDGPCKCASFAQAS